MRLISSLTACLLLPIAAGAQDKPPAAGIDLRNPAALIGKQLDADRAYEAGLHAPKMRAEDWTYGFQSDEALERAASTADRAKSDVELDTVYPYNQRCARNGKTAPFTFGGGERYKLKGAVEKGRYAEGWLYFADKGIFDPTPVKAKLAFSENDAALHLSLDPAEMARRGALAICPTAAPPGAAGAACSLFSLKGFARAYDFVCDAK
jgi:hypothetical protein